MNEDTNMVQNLSDRARRLIADDSFFFAVLIVLVALTSFGLGRWSALENSPLRGSREASPAIVIKSIATSSSSIATKATTTQTVTPAPKLEPKYVGSRSGTKYHLLWCPGAKTIKESNKVYFASKEEAERAGYSPAANCKGI
jgi:hypothetical protein